MKSVFPFPRSNAWKTGKFEAPWQPDRPSIFAFLSESQATDDATLPDDARANEGHAIRFVAGALDNLIGNSEADPDRIVALIGKVMANPTRSHIARLYDALCEDGAIGVVDGAIDLISQSKPDPDKHAQFFDWLARSAPDREPVKFAIAMLGMLQGSDFESLFLTLGSHEEFTKYAAVALGNALPPDAARSAQTELARNVHGWGRIDLVERLAPEGDEAFRHWLVRKGFRNNIMYEYLAWTAAHYGRLREQLDAPGAAEDDALIDGASEILEALVNGGPAADIRDYDDAVPVAHVWLDLVSGSPGTLLRAGGAERLLRHSERDDCCWPDAEKAEIARKARSYLDRPELTSAVTEGLRSGKNPDFWRAKDLAPALGIDPWPFIHDLQLADREADHWFDLMQTKDPERIDRALDLACAQLPYEGIATGPAEEMGFGPEWKVHSALDFIVQALDGFPGKGWPLISVSLRSPVVRNRSMAIRALEAWPRQDWPEDALALLRQAARDEPDDRLRERIETLLRPRPA